jgi:type III secretory pathway component EscV
MSYALEHKHHCQKMAKKEGYTYRFTTMTISDDFHCPIPFIAIMLSHSAHCCHVRVLIDRLADQFLLLYHCLSLKVLSSLFLFLLVGFCLLDFGVLSICITGCSSTVTAKQQQQTRQEPFGSSGEKAAATAAVVVLQEIPAAEFVECCSQGHPSKGHWVVT